MSKKLNRIPKEVLEIAKNKYLEYEAVSDIAKDLNVPRLALQYHVTEKWKEERQLMENEVLREIGLTRATKLNLLVKDNLEILAKAVRALKNRDTPPTLKEAQAAANIFESIDKIMRLDKGNPTEILAETKPITIVELRNEVDSIDPFYEADIKEITDEISEDTEENS